jgi:hypothetical protein
MEEVDNFLWIACIDVEESGQHGEQQVLQNGTPINGSPLVTPEVGRQQGEHQVSQNGISAKETPLLIPRAGGLKRQLQRYNFVDVSRMTDGFARTHWIRKGGSCEVYLGKLGGRELAVKRAHKREEPGPSQDTTEQFHTEVHSHTPIDYDNLSCFTTVLIFGLISLPFSYVFFPSYLDFFFSLNANSICNLQKN